MSLAKSKELRFISRIEQGNFRTWWVRLAESTDHYSHKSFPDSRYGGKSQALKTAQKFRDKEQRRLYKEYGIVLPKLTGKHFGKGVHFAIDKRYTPYRESWRATFWDNAKKKQLTKTFSVNVYGTKKAKGLATQWRELKVTGELNDIN